MLKIAVREGVLECVFSRHVPCIEKQVGAARRSIRDHRRQMREDFLERAKKMLSTVLFASRLLTKALFIRGAARVRSFVRLTGECLRLGIRGALADAKSLV